MRLASAIAIALLNAGSGFAAEIPQADRRSGYDFMKPETRAMQNEDTANPGMLWVLDGESLWKRKAGVAGKACADCHDDARTSMKGVAARYLPSTRRQAARSIWSSASMRAAPTTSRRRRCRSRAASC